MLPSGDNEILTRVGRGAPMGNLMRRYWHPVAASVQMSGATVLAVRVLGEDLVLYRDRSGALGLIERYCAHRRVNLAYGIPEERGLRCMYHGWLYNETGQCIEQPFEETVRPEARFKDKIKLQGYPVQELGGLVWAYLGPAPAPLLPRWDLFVEPGVFREVASSLIPCNWLQTMENAMDGSHLEHLHWTYGKYVLERMGVPADEAAARVRGFSRKHIKLGFDVFEHGIIKRRVLEGGSEEEEDWQVGHPMVFPNTMRMGNASRSEFQIRVPVDDENTLQWYVLVHRPGVDVSPQVEIPYFEVPMFDEAGRYIIDFATGQDMMTWVSQGSILDRSKESLGESDRGIILFRRLLMEQMAVNEDGGDPMNVMRDPAKNDYIELPQERNKYHIGDAYRRLLQGSWSRYSPSKELVASLYAQGAAQKT